MAMTKHKALSKRLMLVLIVLLAAAISNEVSGFIDLPTRSLRSALRMSSSAKIDEVSTGAKSLDPEHDILLRAFRGEKTERTPVWLMRQAGRYMAEFRKFSEKYPFRMRSETPEIAIELSLQPWRAFGVDGVIMFSDILTPLPAMGVDFTIVPGKGPKIMNPIKTQEDVEAIQVLQDPATQVPFIQEILGSLRSETEGKTSLIGFIGAPWTLAAYSVEGGHSKLCAHMKKLCYENPELAHVMLQKYADSLCLYAGYQIESGAQILQIFESWSHHMPEEMWLAFAQPYVQQVTTYLQNKYPDVPVVYFANGGSGYLKAQCDHLSVDGISIDWKISMESAKKTAGNMVIAGNVDPITLYGTEANIRKAAQKSIDHGCNVLNLGHGVEKDTPEEAVAAFVDTAKQSYK
jgi:uroporphyrinogen decarboxylase